MGKTQKPLKILVTRPWMSEWPEMQALMAQGHVVHDPITSDLAIDDYDLILGPTCWRMNEQLRHYLDTTIRAARQEAYGKKAEDGD